MAGGLLNQFWFSLEGQMTFGVLSRATSLSLSPPPPPTYLPSIPRTVACPDPLPPSLPRAVTCPNPISPSSSPYTWSCSMPRSPSLTQNQMLASAMDLSGRFWVRIRAPRSRADTAASVLGRNSPACPGSIYMVAKAGVTGCPWAKSHELVATSLQAE